MWKIAATTVVVVQLAGLCAGQEAASQPATGPAPTPLERLNDLLGLIEGQNSPEVRRTVARELLLQRWPETPPRLVSLLSGSNGPAKVAAATALVQLPEFLDPVYIEPFMGMLSDADPAVRQAAATALAAYPNNGVTARLRQLVLDSTSARTARLAGLSALGLMTEREAIEILVQALADPDEGLAEAALAALEQATAMGFDGDVAAARAWWEESSALPREAWQQLQIERLVRKDRETRRRLEALEARLSKVLEASFLRAPDAERATLLAGYLADNATAIRLLGLRLVQLHLAEGKSLPSELQDRVRELLDSRESPEQAAAVQTVTSFREPRDARRFIEMLPRAHSREVRLALLNGLGYLGTESATEALLSVLADPDEQCATEAVAALGRLAERGVLAEKARDQVAVALLSTFEKTQPAQVALRERVLWAMGNVADLRFGSAFVAALERQEAVVVRQAAVRGIAALRDPQLADALALATNDPDPGVRKMAVETLAAIGSGSNDKHLQALWERVVSPQEAEEAIRQAAWRGVLDLLSKGLVDDVERWLARLPAGSPQNGQRMLELLERLAKMARETEPVDHARLGRIHARLAAQYSRLEQPTEALGAYLAALADLRTADPESARRVAWELLRFALVSGRYDETIASAVAAANSPPDQPALWQAVRAEIQARLTPDLAGQALSMLTAVERYPPGPPWAPEVVEEIKQLRLRAQELKQSPAQSAPATQTADAPALPEPA